MTMGCGLENKVQEIKGFFKSKVHYLGYLVGTDDVQLLPQKVSSIQALKPPKDFEELWHFLGLVGF